MALRNYTPDSSSAHRSAYGTDRLRQAAADESYFPHAHVSILDIDFLDEDASEPDGVNDFIRHLRSEKLDRL